MGIWVEIVTLLIPGFNDSDDEIERLTSFLAGVSPDIPWHVTAFHKDYRMNDPENTTPEMLMRAAADRRAKWAAVRLRGEHPGPRRRSRAYECHNCRAILVERYGYFIQQYRLTPDGRAPTAAPIPGRWGAGFDGQITSTPFLPVRGDYGCNATTPEICSGFNRFSAIELCDIDVARIRSYFAWASAFPGRP